jgi:hypothetical protein
MNSYLAEKNHALETLINQPGPDVQVTVPQHLIEGEIEDLDEFGIGCGEGRNVTRDECFGSCARVRLEPFVLFASEFLPRWPEEDLVHVHVLWLADGERHHVRKGLRRYRELSVEVADAGRDVRLRDAVGQLGRDRARRDDGRADVIGLHLLAETGMSHIAIQEALNGSTVDWMERVSDQQYGSRSQPSGERQ